MSTKCRAIEQLNGGSYYCRLSSSNQKLLESKLASNYHAKQCHIVSSGLAAISTIMFGLHLKHKNDHVNLIYSKELYSDTPDVFTAFKQFYFTGATTTRFDPTGADLVDVFSGYMNQINILCFESCSNPHGYIMDLSLIDKLRSMSSTLYVIIDNTWLTDVVFNPINYANIDFVAISLTKYYSAGNLISGAILSFNDCLDDYISFWMEIAGPSVCSDTCGEINQLMDSMPERINQSSKMTMEIMQQVIKLGDPLIDIVHPCLPNHVSNGLAKQYFNGLNPSIFIMLINATDDQINEALEKCPLDLMTSYGCEMSRIEASDTYRYDGDDYGHVRLTVGYGDDVDRVVGAIQKLLLDIKSIKH